MRLKFFWIKRTECGCNILKLYGQYKEIVTHDFFIAKQLIGTEKISSINLEIRMGNGVKIIRKCQTSLSNIIKELFTSANPMFPKEVLLTINTRVSAQMNNRLSTDFKAWEVHEAVKQWPLSRHPVWIPTLLAAGW